MVIKTGPGQVAGGECKENNNLAKKGISLKTFLALES